MFHFYKLCATQNAVNSRFKSALLLLLLGQDNAVSIITGIGGTIRCSIPGRGEFFFSPTERPDHMWGLPRSYAVGTWVLAPMTKRPEREIDQAPICNAIVKNE